jgi:crotonobetainyl-CoA:carnitine CoA-transferase CaiB-like acyl-CoA transferase
MNTQSNGTCDISMVPLQRTGDVTPHVAEPEARSAVERYKEIIGSIDEAVGAMRAQDQARVADLIARLVESQNRMADVIDREKVVELGARLHWESAVEALWDERWMRVSPMPGPDETAPARDQREYITAMDLAYQVLEDSLQKRTLLRRKKE